MQEAMLYRKLKQALAQRVKQTVTITDGPLSPAAVLIPLYERDGEYYVLLTKRTETLVHHRGQICFPGGAVHHKDRNLQDTALRETFEEIGVPPADVQLLGELDNMGTVTSNFLITPFVGVIPYPCSFTVSQDEIDELVEVPLASLADESNYREEEYVIGDNTYTGSIFDYEGKVIWGATARILKQLLEIIADCGG